MAATLCEASGYDKYGISLVCFKFNLYVFKIYNEI